jgi:hypothetical protein
MTSRLLLTGTLESAAVRRNRKADGVVFAIVTIKDTDRGWSRIWTAFAGDLDLIEQLEQMRIGSPLAVCGPFAIAVAGTKSEPKIDHRITIESILDFKRKRKSKRLIREEEKVTSDELDDAPLNDDLPAMMMDPVALAAHGSPG